MTKDYPEEGTEVDAFEDKPIELRDNDEITDAEEAFMEGYEEEEEEKEDEEKEKFEDFE